ncbi:uncharacterized protein C12orf43-like isoform X1 [Carlito syrichta]|uniref:Protein CUSTOS n=1 Tax=Carlito syrichta TaxID=1868482 RepID=A0A1U7T8F1_CARSF|nr:uncharacterized protein C12orf43-like isoform X1 [Carlito syrichta]
MPCAPLLSLGRCRRDDNGDLPHNSLWWLKMAVFSGAVRDSENGSSGSDGEELARSQEVAIPSWDLKKGLQGPEKPRSGGPGEQSQGSLGTWEERLVSGDADSALWILHFCLFFTSIPGGPEKEASPPPCHKRQPSRSSSSEHSDEERQRCWEAAVSVSDILWESAIHSPVREEKEARKKRKSEKKAKKAASVHSAVTTTVTTNGAMVQKQEESGKPNGDQMLFGTKKKKRKEKAKKASEASLFPPAKSAAAVPAN